MREQVGDFGLVADFVLFVPAVVLRLTQLQRVEDVDGVSIAGCLPDAVIPRIVDET